MRQKPAMVRGHLWRALVASGLLVTGAGGAESPAYAQGFGFGQGQYAPGPSGAPHWAEAAGQAALSAPLLRFFGAQTTPATVPTYQTITNPLGASATYQPAGPTTTAGNAFFAQLGTNGRTCASCHAASAGWSITPVQVQALFWRSLGTDPLFQPVDGANCSTADVSSMSAQLASSSLLLSKGLIRIFEKLPVSPAPQYSIVAVQDPYACNTSTVANVGLTAYGAGVTPAGFVSVYRRPLPSVNLPFLSTILADGREATLAQQAADANRIHAQATPAQVAAITATSPQVAQMLAFEEGIYSAQSYSYSAGDLTTNGGGGGPVPLASLPFYITINDAFGNDATGAAFNQNVYSLYSPWAPGASGYGSGYGWTGQAHASIARGESIFNTRNFTISGVTGLNDVLGERSMTGTCSTCHDAPNAGSNSNFLMVDTGVTTPGAANLDQSGLPVFSLQCVAGPLAGQTFTTTDPGRAILSGQCSDINRLKVPTLRNLAARPPYFHNGSAATVGMVVNFYNARFNIGLSNQDQADLANFLNSL